MYSYLSGSDVTETDEDDEVFDVGAGQSSHLPTLTSWKKDFGRSINAIKTSGDVSWSKQYQYLMLPGLIVGDTPISLPLVTPRDAEVIRKACHQAPFGRGDETVVDESVRKTWEIGHEGFSFSNPQWPIFVDTLLKEASVSLGMPNGVRAEPFKLLLYDPGSFFKPHKDSEKAPGMIATLVICLPSAHEGGDVHVSHGGRKHTLTTSATSAFEATALAWYSDVTHEVKEITSGHRLVLTYNIVLGKNKSNQASASGVLQQQVALESMLKVGYNYRNDDASRLLYALSHKYSETSLSMYSMKGHDRARVHALWKACESSGYLLLLANVTKSQEGFDDEYYDGNDEEEYHKLTYLATLEGFQVGSDIEVEPNFIGVNPYSHKRRADSEDEGDFTGNENAPSAYRYHDSAAVIVRKDDLAELLSIRSLSDDNFAKNVAKLVASCYFDKEKSLLPNDAIGLLKQLVGYPKRRMGQTLAEILSVAANNDDMNLWNEVINNATVDFSRVDPTYSYYSRDYRPFGGLNRAQNDAQDSWNMGSLTPVLSRFALHLNGRRLPRLNGDWDKYLGSMITNLPSLDNVETALDDLLMDLKRDDVKDSLRKWRLSIAENRFSRSTHRLKAKDSSMVMNLLQNGKDPEWVNNSLLPVLKCRADKSLLLVLIPALLDHVGTQDMKTVARIVLDGTMTQLKPDVRDLVPIVESSYSRDGQSHWGAHITATVYGESQVARFMTLTKKCMLHGLWDEAAQLIDNCCSNVAQAHKGPIMCQHAPYSASRRAVSVSYVPSTWAEFFLADVVNIIQQSARPAPESFKSFFERLVKHHILAEIPPYPEQPIGWAHKRNECPRNTYVTGEPDRCRNSGACRELNDFLESQTEQTHGFSMTAQLRKHIQYRLSPEYFGFHTTKGRGSMPGTLVVTKLGTEYQADVQTHLANIRNLEKRLQAYRIPLIQGLLGDRVYAEFVLLERIRTPPGAAEGQLIPLSYGESDAAALPGILAPASGNKRPASGTFEQSAASKMRVSSLIDLTGDD